MHKVTFFPLGNADCCRIDLDNGRKALFDYADMRDPDDDEDRRCDLPTELREDLDEAGRDFFDVVAFTHLDEDHYKGASEFFWLKYAKKYQDEDRIKIETLWIPADIITEKAPDNEEARILQREARYRFRAGEGIRVFSRPERLRKWCADNDIDLEDRLHLITDAGQLAPEFTLAGDNAEFFAHSPFAFRQDENTVEDRNGDCLVMQAVFSVEGVETKLLLLADAPYSAISDIVTITRSKNREARLEWDIVKAAHHCSYLSLSDEKGRDKTVPVEEVAWLYEEQGLERGVMVSTSDPIPSQGSPADKNSDPPHRQAANYYKDVLDDLAGQFKVTMEEPQPAEPRPIVVEIGIFKATLKKQALTGPMIATRTRAPRAG